MVYITADFETVTCLFRSFALFEFDLDRRLQNLNSVCSAGILFSVAFFELPGAGSRTVVAVPYSIRTYVAEIGVV